MRFVFASFLILLTVKGNTAQLQACGNVQLVAVQKATLPFPISHTTAAYNNYDSIYLFGGLTNGNTPMNQIYKYSMSANTVTQVATLPSSRYGGLVLRDGVTYPKMVFMGVDGDGSSTDPIFRFDPFNNNQLTTIGQIQTVTQGLAAVETGNSQAYVFGGPDYPWANVTLLDMRYGNNSIVGNSKLGMTSRGSATIMPATPNDILVLGAGVSDTQLDNRIIYFNTTDKSSDILGTIFDLPNFDNLSATYDQDNNFLWIVGGYNGLAGESINGIYQIDLDTLGVTFFPVTGFPSSGDMWLSATSAVYTQGRWKLLFFGGLMRNSTIVADPGTRVSGIWEIDLTPSYCCGKSTGLFAHPDDCTRFISCSNQITSFIQCPAFLYFDPILKICNFLNLVSCALSNLLQF